MKETVFTKYHIENGAKMAEFAGFNMPIEFSGINDEHMTVRQGAGVFDVSHMGEIWVKGEGCIEFLQHITSNDISKLYDGKAQYSCFPNGKGGIVDDIIVYRFSELKYMICVNAANIDKDWQHVLREGAKFGMKENVNLENASNRMSQLAVQGPKAMQIIQDMTDEDVLSMEYYTFRQMKLKGMDVILSITGYTGAGGCEIYFHNSDSDKMWAELWKAGEKYGLKNIGLGARDTLRLEKGFCLYGDEIDDTTSPLEAGLGWITKFVDGKDFIDREFLERQKAEGVTKKLVGIKLIDRGVPRHEYEIGDENGNPIGKVTSGTMSPCLKVGIALGYVPQSYSKVGTAVTIIVRGRALKGEVVKLPFV
ncbi:MAG: glycine cleavage system aminomethyltransferase GcvT [Alistipes sp.]|nr:glycine cleavage system aminomethyltransferase GcvT [Candidatus Alistipes equi]